MLLLPHIRVITFHRNFHCNFKRETEPVAESRVQAMADASSLHASKRPKLSADGPKANAPNSATRIFVGGLDHRVTVADLHEVLAAYGTVEDVHIADGKSYAFARMGTKPSALAATAALDGVEWRGRTMKCRIATTRGQLWVGNIPKSVSNVRLAQAFSTFGPVKTAIVATDEKGVSEGWGVVDFDRQGPAERAFEACNKKPFLITSQTIPLRVVRWRHVDVEVGMPAHDARTSQEIEEELAYEPQFPADGPIPYHHRRRSVC